jgi:hypothetical protein
MNLQPNTPKFLLKNSLRALSLFSLTHEGIRHGANGELHYFRSEEHTEKEVEMQELQPQIVL